jgi:hypothetical protein
MPISRLTSRSGAVEVTAAPTKNWLSRAANGAINWWRGNMATVRPGPATYYNRSNYFSNARTGVDPTSYRAPQESDPNHGGSHRHATVSDAALASVLGDEWLAQTKRAEAIARQMPQDLATLTEHRDENPEKEIPAADRSMLSVATLSWGCTVLFIPSARGYQVAFVANAADRKEVEKLSTQFANPGGWEMHFVEDAKSRDETIRALRKGYERPKEREAREARARAEVFDV